MYFSVYQVIVSASISRRNSSIVKLVEFDRML